MITTIQIRENVKNQLDRMKYGKETYEDIIIRMMNQIDEQRRKQTELMIEGAKETAGESLKITKEFGAIDEDFDWEWEDK